MRYFSGGQTMHMKNGYSQDEFEDGIQQFNDALEAMQPDLEAETKALGDNAEARIEAVSLWSQKFSL